MIQQVRVIANFFLKMFNDKFKIFMTRFLKNWIFLRVRGSQFWVTVWNYDLVSKQQAFVICLYWWGYEIYDRSCSYEQNWFLIWHNFLSIWKRFFPNPQNNQILKSNQFNPKVRSIYPFPMIFMLHILTMLSIRTCHWGKFQSLNFLFRINPEIKIMIFRPHFSPFFTYMCYF